MFECPPENLQKMIRNSQIDLSKLWSSYLSSDTRNVINTCSYMLLSCGIPHNIPYITVYNPSNIFLMDYFASFV